MQFPCRAHAVPLPCRAAKGLECVSHLIYTVRPCLIHTCHAALMPSPTMPFYSRPRHSTAVESGCVGYLFAFGFFRLPREVPRSSNQTHTNLRCRWPVWNQTPFVMDGGKSGSNTLQKKTMLHCGLAIRIFPATMQTRRTRHCRSRTGARHGMCELTHGMAGERHARCESALKADSHIAYCPSAVEQLCLRFYGKPYFTTVFTNAGQLAQ